MPKALRDSQYRMVEFSRQAMQRKMQNLDESEHERTILASMLKAADPQTGKKFSDQEILINMNLLTFFCPLSKNSY
jgi:cytochrome P450